jgi:hypothetical protein
MTSQHSNLITFNRGLTFMSLHAQKMGLRNHSMADILTMLGWRAPDLRMLVETLM